jgi:hypothetical protein
MTAQQRLYQAIDSKHRRDFAHRRALAQGAGRGRQAVGKERRQHQEAGLTVAVCEQRHQPGGCHLAGPAGPQARLGLQVDRRRVQAERRGVTVERFDILDDVITVARAGPAWPALD